MTLFRLIKLTTFTIFMNHVNGIPTIVSLSSILETPVQCWTPSIIHLFGKIYIQFVLPDIFYLGRFCPVYS